VHKNIPSLLKAFGTLLPEIPHLLVLVGVPGRGEKEVETAIRDINAENRIIRLSRLDYDGIRCLYHGAAVFVLPSLYEGFGLPVLEAMMAGVPVLTTRSASIPEVAGDCALYFEPGEDLDMVDKIRKSLNMEAGERRELIEKARRRAQTFTWEKTARATQVCLRKISG
jgi:alpha-1,3-rhamnosyl/mannosyltransferase